MANEIEKFEPIVNQERRATAKFLAETFSEENVRDTLAMASSKLSKWYARLMPNLVRPFTDLYLANAVKELNNPDLAKEIAADIADMVAVPLRAPE